ncbi:MAG: hypothetical protein ACLR7D_17105 [Lachnospira eligens]
MKPTLRQIEEREKQKKEKRQIDTLIKYDQCQDMSKVWGTYALCIWRSV